MDRRKITSLGVVTILVGAFVYFVGIPAVQTQFHYEQGYPVNETKYIVFWIDDFHTTAKEVNIGFIDDPHLMYRIDVTQNEPGRHHYVQYYNWEDSILVKLVGADNEKVTAIDIILGTGTSYDIWIEGDEMDVTLTYSNGAIIDPNNPDSDDIFVNNNNGNFTFIMTEDVTLTSNATGALFVNVNYCTNTAVVVDLPEGLNGQLEARFWLDYVDLTLNGWSIIEYPISGTCSTIYGTSSRAQPYIYIDVGIVSNLYGYLED